MVSINLAWRYGACTHIFPRTHNDILFSHNFQRIIRPFISGVCISFSASTFHRRKSSKFPDDDSVTHKHPTFSDKPAFSESDFDPNPPADIGVTPDSSGQIFSDYVPQKKRSPGRVIEAMKAKARSTHALQTIKSKDKQPFDKTTFAKMAQKKFVDLNMDLQLKPPTQAIDLRMKENATLLLVKSLKAEFQNPAKTVYWRFIRELEAPKVVNIAIAQINDKTDLYAQITIEMYTEQILAVRDRYERLILGSLKKAKYVTDFVVFEKHISDPYGRWRICGKINKKGKRNE